MLPSPTRTFVDKTLRVTVAQPTTVPAESIELATNRGGRLFRKLGRRKDLGERADGPSRIVQIDTTPSRTAAPCARCQYESSVPTSRQ